MIIEKSPLPLFKCGHCVLPNFPLGKVHNDLNASSAPQKHHVSNCPEGCPIPLRNPFWMTSTVSKQRRVSFSFEEEKKEKSQVAMSGEYGGCVTSAMLISVIYCVVLREM